MSGKKNKRPFDDNEEDIGFRDPSRNSDEHGAENEDAEAEDDLDAKPGENEEDENEEDDMDDEDTFDDEDGEGHGWHTFDMDSPDESL